MDKVVIVEGFEWAENNLDARDDDELQSRGVNVYVAPNISPGQKVVNLADGAVDAFHEGAERPERGYYADFDSLVHYCRETGTPLVETDGQVVLQPTGTDEAGDPLSHRGGA